MGLLFLACAAARAQDSTPSVRAEIVRLDVVVTDAQGRAVSGLQRDDFAVFEDGKRQGLSNVLFVGDAKAGAAASTGDEPGVAAPGAPARRRSIMIVVDEPHLAQRNLGPVKEVLLRFLAEIVAPDDEIAMVVAGSAMASVPPTRDRAALRRGIERIRAREDSIASGQPAQLTPEQAEQILRGDPFALRLAARLSMEEAGSPFSGQVIPKNSSSNPLPAGVEPAEKAAALDAQRQASHVLAEALWIADGSLGLLERALRALAPLSGRKICLFVSGGFLMGRGTSLEHSGRLQQVIDAAMRSGASVYPLLAAGLEPIGGDAAVSGLTGPPGLRDRVARAAEQQRVETLEGLADDTGGFLVRGADATEAGLRRMLQADASTYLLAYVPSNQKLDGRFRKVVVRLPGHRDYVVRTRKGYFAAKASKGERDRPGPPSLVPEAAAARLAAAASAASGPLAMSVRADYLDFAPDGPQAVVKAHLDPTRLAWKEAHGRRRAGFDLVGGVYDESGAPVGVPFAIRHYAFDVDPSEYDALLAAGAYFETRVPLKPGRYEVRMLALDPAQNPLAAARQQLEVPDLAAKALTLSSVFLFSVAAGEGDRPQLRDAQLARHFALSDTLVYQVFVYNAARDAEGKADVLLQVQIRAPGGPPHVSKARPAALQERDGLLLPEGSGIPLSSLGPGSYELRIVAMDRKADATVSRSVDFTIE